MKLRDCGTWLSGATPPREESEYWTGDTPWVSTKDMTDLWVSDADEHISQGAALRYCRVAPAGAVLISVRGMALAKRLPVGVTTRAMAFNQDLKALVCRPGINPRYLAYALLGHQRRILGLVEDAAHGTKRLGTDLMRQFPLELPDVSVQERIAGYLDRETDRIDALVQCKRHLARLLDERRTAVIVEAMGGFPLVALSRTWRVIDCKHRTPAYVSAGYPLVSTGDIHPGVLDLQRTSRFVSGEDFADLTEGRRPARGDVIYSRNASVGTAAYVETAQPFCMGQDVCLLKSEAGDGRFLAHFLNTLARPQIEAQSIGSTFKRINVAQITRLRIPDVPYDQQHGIADELDRTMAEMDALTSAIERQLALFAERREALVTAAVTGQIDVTAESSDDAASEALSA